MLKIIDSMCGTGKTTYMMQTRLKQLQEQEQYEQVVYISPLLSEVGGYGKDSQGNLVAHQGRINTECPDLNFQQPDIENKGASLRSMLKSGVNISASHALFLDMTTETLELIQEGFNILVVDEVLDVLKPMDKYGSGDIKLLIDQGAVTVDSRGKLEWHSENFSDEDVKKSHFQYLKESAESGNAYVAQGPDGQYYPVMWSFPPEILEAFTDVYVLTYRWEGSVMCKWLDIMGIEWEYEHPELHETTEAKLAIAKKHLSIIHGREANPNYTLSYKWYEEAAKDGRLSTFREKVEKAVDNYMRKVKPSQMLVTCPQDNWDCPNLKVVNKKRVKNPMSIKGKRYGKATWLDSNCKATNEHSDKTALLYLVNKHPRPKVNEYCQKAGCPIDKEEYSLSAIVQWVWRSAIRNRTLDSEEAPVILYIPNLKARLLLMWLLGYTKKELLDLGYTPTQLKAITKEFK